MDDRYFRVILVFCKDIRIYEIFLTEKILSDVVPRCEQCQAVVKPDAVFFGEPLPRRFRLVDEDFPRCDLLIILGTSLVVQPFASLVDR